MKEVIIKIQIIDPEQNKKIWMRLVSDAFDRGLTVELADFLLENPGLSIQELDRQFRDEHNIQTLFFHHFIRLKFLLQWKRNPLRENSLDEV